MDKQKRHNHPTTDQLRQYVAGGLSHEEQHQVEKAALQNPQIDDTLEGLIALKETGVDTETTLVELRQRLLGRVEKKDKRLFPFYYASAAAVVLAVGLSWWLVKERAESPAAVATSSVNKETTEPIEEAAPLSAAVPIPQKEGAKTPKIATASPPKKKAVTTAPTQPLPAAVVGSEHLKKEEAQEVFLSEAAPTPQPAENPPSRVLEESSKVARTRTAAIKASASAPANEPLFTLRGRVIDATHQQALVGGTVALVGHSTSVMTDSNGNFILRNIPRNSQLIIKSIGYQPTQLTVKDSILPIIAMQEDKQVLSEVVVSSHPDKNQKVSPKNGWKAYNDYLTTSAAQFVAQNPQAPSGRVVVGFTIDKTGELKDFKNKNKANPQLFEEAVRIVKEGEKWNTSYKKGKPQTESSQLVIDF